MANVLSPLPKQKFFTNNGAPADGYRLFTYAAGTSTKLSTYQDDTTGSPNSNPITLNFRGECNVWIPPNVAYKYVFAGPGSVLDDPPTNVIWTVDDIVSAQLITLYGGVDTGIANAYVLNFVANFTAYTDGIVIYWIPSHTNTGPSTVNVNGLGPINIVNPDGSPLYLGELVANQFSAIIYSGGSFKLFAFGFLPNIDEQNTNYTLALSNAQGIVTSDGVGPYTWTIPTDSTVAFPIGTSIELINNGISVLTVEAAVGVVLRGPAVGIGVGATTQQLLMPNTNTACRIVKVDANDWQVTSISWARLSGTFTGTLTGMTAPTTGTISYSYSLDGLVTLRRDASLSDLTGTSNTTALTMTGLPSELSPKFSSTRAICYGVVDSGTALPAVALISSTSVITFLICANPPVAFTAAGTKGLQSGWQLTYRLS